jgi:hypothetical protein
MPSKLTLMHPTNHHKKFVLYQVNIRLACYS